jgi:pimeloyl-ACP methyl ester carboxylesterase
MRLIDSGRYQHQGSSAHIARRIWAFSIIGALAWLALIALMVTHEATLVFGAGFSQRSMERWTPFDSEVFKPVSIRTADGLRLEGVTTAKGTPEYWILFSGASRATIHSRWSQEQLRDLWLLGYGILAFDYRGFGRNSGVPTEDGLYTDASAAYDYLTRDLTVPASRVILAGQSLGSAVALELALRVPSAGVVLFSPIDSVPAAGSRRFPWAPVRRLARNQFDNLAKAGRLRVPALVAHARDDHMMPIETARAFFETIPAPKFMLETGGGHNDAGFASPADLKKAFYSLWPPLQ